MATKPNAFKYAIIVEKCGTVIQHESTLINIVHSFYHYEEHERELLCIGEQDKKTKGYYILPKDLVMQRIETRTNLN